MRPAEFSCADRPLLVIIALIAILAPVENHALTLTVSGASLRPVYAPMLALVILEALRLSRPTLATALRWTMPVLGLLLVWVVVATAAGLWPDQSHGYTLWLLATIVFAVAVVHSTVRVASITAWLNWTVAAATTWALVIIVLLPLSLAVPQLRFGVTLSGLPRIAGPLTEPSFAAVYLVPLVFLAILVRRPVAGTLIAVGALATTSRLGVIGLIAGGVTVGVLMLAQRGVAPSTARRPRAWVRPAVIGAVAAAALAVAGWRLGYFQFIATAANPNEASSSAPRLQTWHEAAAVARHGFPAGSGPGSYSQVATEIGIPWNGEPARATNLPLEVLGELGLIGLIDLALWFAWPVIGAWRRGVPARVRTGVTAGMVALLATSPFFQTWQRPYTWLFWAVAVGAVAAAVRERAR